MEMSCLSPSFLPPNIKPGGGDLPAFFFGRRPAVFFASFLWTTFLHNLQASYLFLVESLYPRSQFWCLNQNVVFGHRTLDSGVFCRPMAHPRLPVDIVLPPFVSPPFQKNTHTQKYGFFSLSKKKLFGFEKYTSTNEINEIKISWKYHATPLIDRSLASRSSSRAIIIWFIQLRFEHTPRKVKMELIVGIAGTERR